MIAVKEQSPSATSAKDLLLDRALGSFLGLAIGDALGATVEFMTAREIAAQFKVHNQIIGGGWLRESLIVDGRLPREAVANVSVVDPRPRSNCRGAFRALSGLGPRKRRGGTETFGGERRLAGG